jgi:hypothetical protein
MNRRSFLGLLPLAPIVGPALAKEAATGIADAIKRERIPGLVGRMRAVQPNIATLGLSVDSSALERAVSELRQLPAATRIVAGSAAKEATAFANMLDQPPDDIWPI